MSDDMITMPEDPDAPTPGGWTPQFIAASLRDETSADWQLDDVTVRYDAGSNSIVPIGLLSSQQLAGLEFLKVDPQPPQHVVDANNRARAERLRAEAARLDAQAVTAASMHSAMHGARTNPATNSAPNEGEGGAKLAEMFVQFIGFLLRKKASDKRAEADSIDAP